MQVVSQKNEWTLTCALVKDNFAVGKKLKSMQTIFSKIWELISKQEIVSFIPKGGKYRYTFK
jgi:hypothetical protein